MITEYENDIAILITRGQIVTKLGHFRLFKEALKRGRKVLWFVGSANLARDTRNPFTFKEREAMITDAIADMVNEQITDDFGGEFVENEVLGSRLLDVLSRVQVIALNDTGPYGKNEWIAQVQQHVKNATKVLRPRVTLIGNIRDTTSEYLTWFPQWPYTPVEDNGVNATALRKAYFAGNVNFRDPSWSDNGYAWADVLYPSTIEFLERFRGKPEYAYLMAQKKAEDAYRDTWGEGPFITVDCVIECAGHVVRVRRGGPEGFGMKALPGGFFNAGESLAWAAAREGVEETAIFIRPEDYPAFDRWLAACCDHAKAFFAWKKAKMRGEDAGAKPIEPVMPDFVQAAITQLLGFLAKTPPQVFDDPNRSRRAHLVTHAHHFLIPDPPLGHTLPLLRGSDDAADAAWDPISEIDPSDTFEDHAFIVDRMLSLNA